MKLKQISIVKLITAFLLLTALSTAPAAVLRQQDAGAQTPWKFIVVSDSRGINNGINLTILRELVSEIRTHKVDLVLFAGDLVYGIRGTPTEFENQLKTWVQTMQPVYDDNIPVYVCRGNHELGDVWQSDPNNPPDPNDNFAIRWLKIFGSDTYPEQKLPSNGPPAEKYMTYSITHKNAFIIALDEYAGIKHRLEHKINQTWLDNQLAANTKPHIFAAAHEPAFRTYHDDCLDNHPAERNLFWASLVNAGARVYLCGHDHFYDHARVDDGDDDPNNDIHQYIIGTAGARPYNWSPPYSGNNSPYILEQRRHAERYGYVLVEVNDLDVTLIWIQRNTNNLDTAGTYETSETWSYSVVPGAIVMSPNGGENLVAENTYSITWKTLEGAQIAYVRIEYSSDAGQNWQNVTISENIGSCRWQVPPVDSNQCLVRISDPDNPDASDTSDNLFTIFRCQTELAGDLNNDCYVDFLDFGLFIQDWLKCGNPFDPACDVQQ